MKVAIAGVGGAAVRGHLPAISRLSARRSVRLVGAADPSPAGRAAFRAAAPGKPAFATAEEMLATLEPDLLVVATEPAHHARLAALGLRAGSHVLCEKPVALSQAQLRLAAEARARSSGLALVPVHQYRFSPAWAWVAEYLRLANRLGRRFELRVDIRRTGTDRQASSNWRADTEASGGILIDHGAHFLALAQTVSANLRVLAAERSRTAQGAERSTAVLAVGSGRLEMTLDGTAERRATHLRARAFHTEIAWRDSVLGLSVAGRETLRREVSALSERAHVDSLYVALYRRMIENVGCPAWRQRRFSESLAVARAGIALVERSRR